MEAEDITAETFKKLWKIRHNFDSHQNIKAFLYITARNVRLDCLRERQNSTDMQQEMLCILLQNNDLTFIHDEIKADVLSQAKEGLTICRRSVNRYLRWLFGAVEECGDCREAGVDVADGNESEGEGD